LRYVLVLLALAGIVVSYLALRVHYGTESAPCSINEKWDCGIVNHSPYAEVRGVPVAAIGIAGYFLIAILALLRRRWLLMAVVAAGTAFALHLSYIEAKVLGVWCVYCVISQALIAVLLLLSVAWAAWHAMRPDPA
jgi:vitamin-K-epoxide reductase (warfarin-sensitive)